MIGSPKTYVKEGVNRGTETLQMPFNSSTENCSNGNNDGSPIGAKKRIINNANVLNRWM